MTKDVEVWQRHSSGDFQTFRQVTNGDVHRQATWFTNADRLYTRFATPTGLAGERPIDQIAGEASLFHDSHSVPQGIKVSYTHRHVSVLCNRTRHQSTLRPRPFNRQHRSSSSLSCQAMVLAMPEWRGMRLMMSAGISSSSGW